MTILSFIKKLHYTLTPYALFLVPDVELLGPVLSMHCVNEFFPFFPAALWGWGMSNQIQQMSFGHQDCSIYFQISASSWHLLQFKYLSAPGLLIYMIESKIQKHTFWIPGVGCLLPIKKTSLSKSLHSLSRQWRQTGTFRGMVHLSEGISIRI